MNQPGKLLTLCSCGIALSLLAGCDAPPAPAATPTPVIAFATNPPAPTATQPAESVPTPGCPNPDCVYITPAAVQAEPLRFSIPTPGAEPQTIWRPPQFPVPFALGPYDHFYFARPIAADEINWPLANYRYGGVFFKNVTHTGVDIPAKPGTLVLAVGSGTVVWADWGLFSGAPDNYSDPYGRAVAIRHDFGYQSQPLYTIYAHMREVYVTIGQWVETGTALGEVGDTGVTTGPHLHLEVRLGENSFYNTLNPELWVAPPQGWGVLAGHVMQTDRENLHSFPVKISSVETGREWEVNTYGPEAVNSDPYYNENMVISDLPAGEYTVSILYDGNSEKLQVEILPGHITYFSFRGSFGYSSDLPAPPPLPTPLPSSTPAKP
jgi:murein DD-endopeptidase MepM/ murein hydrolase activator NlpD